MLSRISIAGKWMMLYFSMSFPFVLIGHLFGGPAGVALGLLLGGLVVFALSMLSEQIVFNAHRASGEPPVGLVRSYRHVVESPNHTGRVPEIYVFPDPSPLALVARNPGSEGLILLSQGVISSLNEQDLRGLLSGCLERISSPRVPLSTVSGVLALGFVRFVPSMWLDVLLQSESNASKLPVLSFNRGPTLPVLSAFRLLSILPLIRYFLFLGRGERQLPDQWVGFAARCGARHWFRMRHPALFHLYLTG